MIPKVESSKYIKTCHWEITKKCNLSCIHCISATKNKKELNTKECLRVINNLKNLGCKEIYITGGEAFFKKDIFKILKLAKENKMKIGLLTNGTLLNHQNIKQIKAYVDELGISLDGSCPEINDKIRGKETFKKIIKAISLVKNQKIPLTLYVTICKVNIDDFGEILKLCSKFKIKSIRVNEVSLRGRGYKNRKIISLNQEQQKKLKKYFIKNLKNWYAKNAKTLIINLCEVNYSNIFLSPLGYIYPCIEVFQRKPTNNFGNILKKNPKFIKDYKTSFTGLSKKNCPYQFIVGKNFALCLNNPSVKCPFIIKYAK